MMRARIVVAVLIGCAAAAIAMVKIAQVGHTSDFAVFWLAGRAMLAGQSPYAAVYPGIRPWIDSGFLYPMPAALYMAPFAMLPEHVGAILFAGVGAGALAFGLTRESFDRLPILMSLPMLLCLTSIQWAPIIAAATLLPTIGGLIVCKPTIGAAAFLAKGSLRHIAGGLVLLVLSLLVRPEWPLEWWHALSSAVPGSKIVPAAVLGGPLLFLAALRWRQPEARLLLALGVVPQTVLFCDQLMLGLVVRTRREALVAGLWSYAVPVGGYLLMRGHLPTTDAGSFTLLSRLIVWGYYLPTLALVLWRRDPVVKETRVTGAITGVPES